MDVCVCVSACVWVEGVGFRAPHRTAPPLTQSSTACTLFWPSGSIDAPHLLKAALLMTDDMCVMPSSCPNEEKMTIKKAHDG